MVNFSRSFFIFLLAVVIISCKKEKPIEEEPKEEPDFKSYLYTYGSQYEDTLVASVISIGGGEMHFFGNTDLSGMPDGDSIKSATFQNSGSDTIYKALFDENLRVSRFFYQVNGINSEKVMSCRYVGNDSIYLYIHGYNWISQTDTLLLVTGAKIQSDGSITGSLLFQRNGAPFEDGATAVSAGFSNALGTLITVAAGVGGTIVGGPALGALSAMIIYSAWFGNSAYASDVVPNTDIQGNPTGSPSQNQNINITLGDEVIIIHTLGVSGIQANSATVTSEVLYSNSPITERGIVWSNWNTEPTILDNKLAQGSGFGQYAISINGLNSSSTAYARAYAVNNHGTSYGGVVTIVTNPLGQQGNGVTDIDGNFYESVVLGSQEWMQSNLTTSKLNDGTAITFVNVDDSLIWAGVSDYNQGSPGYTYYNLDTNFHNAYGKLYNFNTVSSNKVCPVGWHVPDTTEWRVLLNYVGGDSVAGKKLKETGSLYWNLPNNASNEALFYARGGGVRYYYSGFVGLGQVGEFWTSTEEFSDAAFYITISNLSESIYIPTYVGGINSKVHGLSIRCVKN